MLIMFVTIPVNPRIGDIQASMTVWANSIICLFRIGVSVVLAIFKKNSWNIANKY